MSRVALWVNGDTVTTEVRRDGDRLLVRVGDREIPVSVQPLGEGAFAVICAGRRLIAHHAADAAQHYLQMNGDVYAFRRTSAEVQAGAGSATRTPAQHHRAPMPGVVTRVLVTPGQVVAAGDALFVLEAMKIETVVRAAAPAVVTGVRAAPGDRVDGGAVVVEVDQVAEGSA
jgi:biotin carboxyl carrier protein